MTDSISPAAIPESDFDALGAMGAHLRQWWHQHAVLEQPAPGTLLIEEGVEEESVYVVMAGEVQVVTSRSDGNAVQLATLHHGMLTGEMSFLDPRLPVASVLAGEHCQVLAVDRGKLLEAVQSSAEVARDLFRLFAEKLSHQLRRQNIFVGSLANGGADPLHSPLAIYAELNDDDLAWLARTGRVLQLQDAEQLIRQGQPVPDLMLVLEGLVRVVISGASGDRDLGCCHRGELLGEISLLTSQGLATASVSVSGAAQVLAIDKRTLDQQLERDVHFASRFYRALAKLLSQRSRDQLMDHGLAERTNTADGRGKTIDQAQLAAGNARFDQLRALLQQH